MTSLCHQISSGNIDRPNKVANVFVHLFKEANMPSIDKKVVDKHTMNYRLN